MAKLIINRSNIRASDCSLSLGSVYYLFRPTDYQRLVTFTDFDVDVDKQLIYFLLTDYYTKENIVVTASFNDADEDWELHDKNTCSSSDVKRFGRLEKTINEEIEKFSRT